ncbi:MBL fold metallo-hydrolase [Agromyces laixinhei]|uniref:MBL fold metallo-hydrolase n=1 Tax=Agromyces laixinhei TaxID=2585717 RepID=UPI0012EE7528|nr:MBL fold metallo-hydrolase [Agromyces laixinhei]
MATWLTVAPGVHQRRYDPFDISIVVIEGAGGLLLVDTRVQPSEAVELAADIADRFERPVRWVVNTHAHFDHTFGNQVFGPGTVTDAAIYGHARIAAHFAAFEGPRLTAWRADPGREPERQWADVMLTPPTHPLAEPLVLDLGDRLVELRPQPPAHTDTDLVLFVPDERVWILGDLIEESGPVMYGSGSFPLGWPGVLDDLAAAMRPDDRVVPGHGRVVDRAFVQRQAAELGLIADRFRRAHTSGSTAAEALDAHDDWPIPVEGLVGAVERAYLALDAESETGA